MESGSPMSAERTEVALPWVERRPRLLRREGVLRRSMLLVLGGCIALAALSLLFPSSPTYDPLAWIVWGREIFELNLKTSAGPSWKPLPVAFTTLFAPLGGAAPWLWLVVARAGALLGVAMAYRLAARLAGVAAGLIAAAGLILTNEWFRDVWLGNSEGLLIALVLWAVERHLAGRRDHALVVGFLAALLRPETWPFLGLYGLWLWLRNPATRRLSLVLAALIPVLWLVPEQIGSGDAFRASTRAQAPAPGSHVPALSHHPVLKLLENAVHMPIVPVLVGAGLGLMLAAIGYRRARDDRTTLVLSLGTLAWVGVVAFMTQHGYSGNARYLLAPAGLACVVAGVGWARAGRAIAARLPLAATAAGAVLLALLVLASLPWAEPRGDLLRRQAHVMSHESALQHDLPDALRAAGGAKSVLACGTPYTGPYQVPRVAWELHVHTVRVASLPPRKPGVIFQANAASGGPLVARAPAGFRPVAQAGPWRVLESCRAKLSS
jgi:MFS family permease